MRTPERVEFVLTDAEHERIVAASQPVPYMVIGGLPSSPQEKANRAWQALAQQRGFVWNSVQQGRDQRHFTAVPLVDHEFEAFDGATGRACTKMVEDADGFGTDCGRPPEEHRNAAVPSETEVVDDPSVGAHPYVAGTDGVGGCDHRSYEVEGTVEVRCSYPPEAHTMEPREYYVGLPVTVTVFGDGRVVYDIDTAEAGQAIREGEPDTNWADDDEDRTEEQIQWDAAAVDADHTRISETGAELAAALGEDGA